MSRGKVYLVGAGPGDKELLTLKGLRLIEQADAVVYDVLACPSILNHTKADCELIFAGKHSGHHYKKQSDTNVLLADLADQGKTVVRLKGGDPFIFGRGGEEAEVLRERNIEFEVVPGISSCYSAAAYAGIPVTHREYASSFHVITGHKKAGIDTPEYDYSVLAKEEGTLVFLMSLSNLPYIAESLVKNGKDINTPAAVIQQGTTSHQKTAVGTLGTIAEEAVKQGIQTPALTVIGDAVRLREKLKWFEGGTMFGKKIILTGTPSHIENIRRKFLDTGADIAEISIIKTTEPDIQALSKLDFSIYSWIVFTSGNGVDIFFDSISRAGIELRSLMKLKFAAIGSATAAVLHKRGINVDCIPEKYESRYLGEKLITELDSSDRVLIMRAENGTEVLPEMLYSAGKYFDTFPLYRTETDYRKKELLNMNLDDADYVVFSSSSAVRAFAEMNEPDENRRVKYISIGGVTTATAEKFGIKIAETAEIYNAEGIFKAIWNCEEK